METINISVIVPVYNTMEYLNRCIESLINQTIDGIEIILINDASTDDSFNICQEYAAKYNNIQVHNLESNIGLGAVRNYGVKFAKGKYIAFLDSDDYVHINMYNVLVKLAEKNYSDIVMCKYENVYSGEEIKYSCIEEKNISYRILEKREEIIKEYLLLNIDTFAWNKVFNREFWLRNQLMFAEGCYYEDINTIAEALNLTNRIVITDNKFYRYFQRNNSIMHTYSQKHFDDYYTQIGDFYKYVNKNYDVKKIELEYRSSKFRLTYNILNMAQKLHNKNCFKREFEILPKQVVIFGASEAGVVIQNYFDYFEIEVLFFLDNSEEKINKYINGVKIIGIENFLESLYTSKPIYIASMYYSEIYLQLKKYGLDKNIVDLNIF